MHDEEKKQGYPGISGAEIRYAGLYMVVRGLASILAEISAEIGPFFEVASPASGGSHFVNLSLVLEPFPDSRRETLPVDHEILDVDTSLYKHLASKGKRWNRGGEHTVEIDLTGTYAVVDRKNASFVLYQKDPSLMVRDAVRAIKGLFTVAIEDAGGVQLHSSSVVSGGKGVLLLGDMWQGKTTLLLELLSGFDVSQLSCDTTVVMPGSKSGHPISSHGWPSPFSVSQGAMADYPELHPFFPEDRKSVDYATLWREGKKSVLTSSLVVDRFRTSLIPSVDQLAVCLVIRFKPAEETTIVRVTDPRVLEENIRLVYLGSRDPIYHNWHGYLTTTDACIEENIRKISRSIFESTETYVLTWAPSAVSLMKRIPFFAKSNKQLKGLLTMNSLP